MDTTRRFEGAGAWSDDGLSRTRLAPVLDGDLVRRLDVGQVAYIYRGGVTFLQIKRLTGRQAVIGHGSEPATIPLPVVAAVPGGWPTPRMAGVPRPGVQMPGRPGGMVLPDVSEVLDEAFGARRD